MDLEVGTQIITESIPMFGFPTVDPYDQQSIDAMFDNLRDLPYELKSGQRVLLCTEDFLTMPPGMCGLVELRSTWARLGFICPPTVVDPGFRGRITLELLNASSFAIEIKPGDAIWSMTYLPTSEPLYEGRYQGQTGIQLPRALRR